jgi:putative DNA primase/helicase
MSSVESALIDFGIDPRAVDFALVDAWQYLPTTDKPRNRNGHVLVKPDGAVIVCNMRTDERTVWQPGRGSAAIPLSRRREMENAAALLQQHRRRQQADAARPDHPYLARKGLPPLELREAPSINGWRDRWLICPLYSPEPLERIRNLECINTRGDKRPVKGALRAAVFGFAGPGMPTHTVVICEGWATAAALHVSLEMPIVFAAGKGNLAAVARVWRKGLPGAEIIIAADDDEPGMAEARKAADVAAAWIKRPMMGGRGADWCDVFTMHGAEMVRRGWHV